MWIGLCLSVRPSPKKWEGLVVAMYDYFNKYLENNSAVWEGMIQQWVIVTKIIEK